MPQNFRKRKNQQPILPIFDFFVFQVFVVECLYLKKILSVLYVWPNLIAKKRKKIFVLRRKKFGIDSWQVKIEISLKLANILNKVNKKNSWSFVTEELHIQTFILSCRTIQGCHSAFSETVY
jgi:hypothetical protein